MDQAQSDSQELDTFRARARGYARHLAREHVAVLDSAVDPDPEHLRKAVELYARLGGMVPTEKVEHLVPVVWSVGAAGVVSLHATPAPLPPPGPSRDPGVIDVESVPVAPCATQDPQPQQAPAVPAAFASLVPRVQPVADEGAARLRASLAASGVRLSGMEPL